MLDERLLVVPPEAGAGRLGVAARRVGCALGAALLGAHRVAVEGLVQDRLGAAEDRAGKVSPAQHEDGPLQPLRGGPGHQGDELRVAEVRLLVGEDALVHGVELLLRALEEDEGMSISPGFAAAGADLFVVVVPVGFFELFLCYGKW